jgi:zinc protease
MAIVGAGLNVELRDDDPDYAALYIGNHVLGSSAKSRLLNRLRHKGGLSYGAGSFFSSDDVDRRGRIIGFGICATENADKAYDAMLEEILAWHKDGITDEELSDAKTAYALEMKTQYANDNFVASEIARNLFTGRTFKYYADLEKQVQSLDLGQIKKAIDKYFDPGRLVKVKAGDLGKPTPEKKDTRPS